MLARDGLIEIDQNTPVGNQCRNAMLSSGKGPIIGAGSLVNKDISPYSIAFGRQTLVYQARDGAGN